MEAIYRYSEKDGFGVVNTTVISIFALSLTLSYTTTDTENRVTHHSFDLPLSELSRLITALEKARDGKK